MSSQNWIMSVLAPLLMHMTNWNNISVNNGYWKTIYKKVNKSEFNWKKLLKNRTSKLKSNKKKHYEQKSE